MHFFVGSPYQQCGEWDVIWTTIRRKHNLIDRERELAYLLGQCGQYFCLAVPLNHLSSVYKIGGGVAAVVISTVMIGAHFSLHDFYFYYLI